MAALAALSPFGAGELAAQQVTVGTLRDLDFGRFVANTGGTVTISPAGLRTRSGGVVLLNSSNTGQAMFTIGRTANEKGKAIVISLPADGSTRLSSGAASMAVNGFVYPTESLSVMPLGGMMLGVGATLQVAPNQAPGNYTGTFPLIVNYQ